MSPKQYLEHDFESVVVNVLIYIEGGKDVESVAKVDLPWNGYTLGTRAQIPTGYMVKTLRSQSTFDSNMPSDQMLSTF